MDIRNLKENEYIMFDGGMGTMLQNSGLPVGKMPETLNIENPDFITSVHNAYIEAGSNIVYANTFGANKFKAKATGYSVDELVKEGIKCAKAATMDKGALVALDIGPLGKLMEPTGDLSFDDAYNAFKEEVVAATDGEVKADIICIETMSDLLETKAAVLAAKENCELPVCVTMSFEKDGRTFTGVSPISMAITLEGLGVDAIGVNCSVGPADLFDTVKTILEHVSIPVIVKPNAGLPDPVTGKYDVLPDEFANLMADMARIGVKVFGGCCGTTPDYIRATKREVSKVFLDTSNINRVEKKVGTYICSPSKVVVVDRPQIIGERINPTGKKRFKEALIAGDIDYILSQAIEQIDGGANILDVNVGLPQIDEKDMMVKAVKALQGITDTPLQLDSTNPEVLEAALRIYSGKPIINSVNGEEKSLKAILPLAKKYGAALVCLTLDEGGIPKGYMGRVEIAKKILSRALEIGIPKENLIIDCLTLTVSAEQEGAIETLKAVRCVKEELGLKTVLGVSNISFGLPNREMINTTFLATALENGLDLPIMNPNNVAMTGTVMAYRVLKCFDKNSMEFIDYFSGFTKTDKLVKKSEVNSNLPVNKGIRMSDGSSTANDASGAGLSEKDALINSLNNAVYKGLKSEGSNACKKLLEQMSALDIVNDVLIPALDVVGENFEKGKTFLPQLILSADVAKVAFDVIKDEMAGGDEEKVSNGKVVLATVKGDIHDIGKNIVKVILENYGYDVIDLGKDVEPQAVVDAAMASDVKLVGLSALMTTTLPSMEKTIELLKEQGANVKTVVGGAVLTADYAKAIGADYYAKDAKETVDVAKLVYGK